MSGLTRLGLAQLVVAFVVASGLTACTDDSDPPPPPMSLRGLAFAPFRDCQSPDLRSFPSEDQLRQDMDTIAGMANGVRTYSALNGAEAAVSQAESKGLRVSAGAWLGPEGTPEGIKSNEDEIAALIALAKSHRLESVIVGNEVLLRGDLTPDRLAAYIERVKDAVDVPVTTAEIASTALREENRVVLAAVEYVMVHIYPYWDGVDIDGAAWYVARTFHDVEKRAGGKRVVIGETGWPSGGPTNQNAVPNVDNAARFLREWVAVARDEGIGYFYFAANDEAWKQERGVGPHWGVLDADRNPKYATRSLLDDPGPAPARPDTAPAAPAGPGSSSGRPADAPAALPDALVLYDDWHAATGGYSPAGWMGDVMDIAMDDCSHDAPHAGRTAVKVAYAAKATGQAPWAGAYWLLPGTDWGRVEGGWDLRGYTTATFWARGEKGGERLGFFLGGVEGPFGDTTKQKQETTVALTTEWRRYAINLLGADLTRVVGAFGWSASRADNPTGATFHLDDIQLDHSPPPRRPCVDPPAGTAAGTRYILDGTLLCSARSPVKKYDFGVDSSGHKRGWLATDGDALRMSYPPGQSWGAVFLTVGKPVTSGRPGQDLSGCHTIQVALRSASGQGSLRVALKDSGDRDSGGEKKVLVHPTTKWGVYSFRLSTFAGVDLTRVYVILEFVFEKGDPAQSVYFRDIRLLCGPGARPAPSGTPVHRPCVDLPAGAAAGTRYILEGTLLCPRWSPVGRYGFGVDSSGGKRNWLTTSGGGLTMAYPSGQAWGAIFLTVGDPVPPGKRPGQNLSGCRTLKIDMRSVAGAGTVQIGMKDRTMPDDGSEKKVSVSLTKAWTTRSFPLSGFGGVDLRQVYVLVEFVFAGANAATIAVRNVRFVC